jgi:O-antigen/teichoic acid export membrane protein
MDDNAAHDQLIGRRVLWSTLTNYAAQIVTMGVGIVLTPFILHQLGASQYGLWVLVGSLVGYGSLLEFGIASAVTKYVAEHRALGDVAHAESLIATALVLYAGLCGLGIGLSIVAAVLVPAVFTIPPGQETTARNLVLVAGCGMAITLPCVLPTAILRGLRRFDLANLITITGTLASAVGTVVVLRSGYGVVTMTAVTIVITVAMQLPSIWLIRRAAPELRVRWRAASRQRLRTVAAFSSSLFVVNVAGQLNAKTDEIVIAGFLPIAAVTPYALARRLSETAQLLTHQFVKVLMPLASELSALDDRERLRAVYVVSTRLALAAYIPVGASLVILAQPLLTLWVGAAYADTTVLVLILTVAGLIDVSQWPAGFVLMGMARHRPLAISALCAGLLNLALSLILVRRYGVTGVALGTLIPVALENLAFVMPYTLRKIGVSFPQAVREMYAPAILPALPTVLFLLWARSTFDLASWLALAAVGGTAVAIYAGVYLLIGASGPERRMYSGFAFSTLNLARGYLRRM